MFVSCRELTQDVLNAFYTKEETLSMLLTKEGTDASELSVHVDSLLIQSDSTCLVILKKATTIDPETPIAVQLDVMSFSGRNALETFLNDFHRAVVHPSAVGGGLQQVNRLRTEISKLEGTFRQCQPVTHIPEPRLTVPDRLKAHLTAGKAPLDLELDDELVTDLRKAFNRWFADTNALVKVDRDVSSGPAANELSFLLSKAERLDAALRVKDSPEMKAMVSIINSDDAKDILGVQAVRLATMLRDDDQLASTLDRIKRVNTQFSGLPLASIETSADFADLKAACDRAVEQLKSKFVRPGLDELYGVERFILFVNAVARDFGAAMVSMLTTQQPLFGGVDPEDRLVSAGNVLQAVDQSFAEIGRDLQAAGMIPAHRRLRQSLGDLYHLIQRTLEFLQQHNKLRQGVLDVFGPTSPMLSALDGSFARLGVEESALLDTTERGEQAWQTANERYMAVTKSVEEELVEILRARLGAASTASQMHAVFRQFHGLFFRPALKSAAADYQTPLLERVEDELMALRQRCIDKPEKTPLGRYLMRAGHSRAVATLLYSEQLHAELNLYSSRVEQILGADWQDHADGAALAEGIRKARQLVQDPQTLLSEWLFKNHVVLEQAAALTETSVLASDGKPQPTIIVNLSPEIVRMFMEARYFVRATSGRKGRISKSASETITRVKTFQRKNGEYITIGRRMACRLVEIHAALARLSGEGVAGWKETTSLLDGLRHKVHATLDAIAKLKWGQLQLIRDSAAALDDITAALTKSVLELTDRATELNSELHKIAHGSIEEVPAAVSAVNSALSDLDLSGFTPIIPFVTAVEARIREILVCRVTELCKDVTAGTGAHAIPSTEAELRFEHGKATLTPSPVTIVVDAHAHLENLVSQLVGTPRPRLVRTGYEPALTDYSDVWTECADALAPATATIVQTSKSLAELLQGWRSLAGLWSLSNETVAEAFGSDIDAWLTALSDLIASKESLTVDTPDAIGHVRVRYTALSQVREKVSSWQKALAAGAMANLKAEIASRVQDAEAAREQAETLSISGDVSVVVKSLDTLQTLMKTAPETRKIADALAAKCQALEPYESSAPGLAVELSGAVDTMQEAIDKVTDGFVANFPTVSNIIYGADHVLADTAIGILDSWSDDKPLGNIPYEEAVGRLEEHRSALTEALDDVKAQIGAVSALLDVSAALTSLAPPNKTSAVSQKGCQSRLLAALEEVGHIADLWEALRPVKLGVASVRQTLWPTVEAASLSGILSELNNKLSALPGKFRTTEPYSHAQAELQAISACVPVIRALSGPMMRHRHWTQLANSVGDQKYAVPAELVVEDILAIGAKGSPAERHVKEVMRVAQGELAIEEFIKETENAWSQQEFPIVTKDDGQRVVREWDSIMELARDNLGNLSGVRASPFFSSFAETIAAWETKLESVLVLLETWAPVQKLWVYLRTVVFGTGDIARQLPADAQRLRAADAEMNGVMADLAGMPRVLAFDAAFNGKGEIVGRLTRVGEALRKVQTALGQYLESQRSKNPRLYFLGDEDLLEILGNQKDITVISKHLPKLFTALGSLVTKEEEEATVIEAVVSISQETLTLEPIAYKPESGIHDLLYELEVGNTKALKKQVLSAYHSLSDSTDSMLKVFESHIFQATHLALSAVWSSAVTQAIAENTLADLSEKWARLLSTAAQVSDGGPKFRALITELTYQSGTVARLALDSDPHCTWALTVSTAVSAESDALVSISVGGVTYPYGWELLGLDRLVTTPLTEQCYLALTQALAQGLGGSPAGPAGTGKTETVKQLAGVLGRHVVVFCCDESFDTAAITRILVGTAELGAFVCFDEFNRLEEAIMSAVSRVLAVIQRGVLTKSSSIKLLDRDIKLNPGLGVFITMNPGYAGRQELPDNLKSMFRSVLMTKPDGQIIAEVMLSTHGFVTAATLASKAVPFFEFCEGHLSSQAHYDWGLRAIRSVLVAAGRVLRTQGDIPEEARAECEFKAFIEALTDSVVPKLVAEDREPFKQLLLQSFRADPTGTVDKGLNDAILEVCAEWELTPTDEFVSKVHQLQRTLLAHHGVMVVGDAGSGKTCVWRALVHAKQKQGREIRHVVIAPKAVSKEELYGTLDAAREWKDGVLTAQFRRIVECPDDVDHWIVLDGSIDPVTVENLNSVLDDNRVLTLPTGERLSLPHNARIVFETTTLKQATLATVSRCGMVWVADIIEPRHQLARGIAQLGSGKSGWKTCNVRQNQLEVEAIAREIWSTLPEIYSKIAPEISKTSEDQIMEFSHSRVIATVMAHLRYAVHTATAQPQHGDVMKGFLSRYAAHALFWSAVAAIPPARQEIFAKKFTADLGLELPSQPIYTCQPDPVTGTWAEMTPPAPPPIKTEDIGLTVVPTMDTVRNNHLITTGLHGAGVVVLVGKAGTGKTMSFTATTENDDDLNVVFLNFSSSTGRQLIVDTLFRHCVRRSTHVGTVLAPAHGKLVLFCDEINLPKPDAYGTVRAIAFLRHVIEHGGFWTSRYGWLAVENVLIGGCCNPPTDAGRVPFDPRFLRHLPLVLVDTPSLESMRRIYTTYNKAAFRPCPTLAATVDDVTDFMINVYRENQAMFGGKQPHYFYSTRELSRWSRAIAVCLAETPVEPSLEELSDLVVHEAMRLFHDRLVSAEDKNSHVQCIKALTASLPTSLPAQELLFTPWLGGQYAKVEKDALADFIQYRLTTFTDEEGVVGDLVLFPEMLGLLCSIDRVLRQPMGHVLLIGASGAGKTVSTRFVSWMDGFTLETINSHAKYTLRDFEDDLRRIMIAAGVNGDRTVLLFDESNVLGTAFLEHMNALLASGDIPGLFADATLDDLISQLSDVTYREGAHVDTEDRTALYSWFTKRVRTNLHVVMTMNPASPAFNSRTKSSPALFNRCVVHWVGDWSDEALQMVADAYLGKVDLEGHVDDPSGYRERFIGSAVALHKEAGVVGAEIAADPTCSAAVSAVQHISPRHFIAMLSAFAQQHMSIAERRSTAALRVNNGIDRITTTQTEMAEVELELSKKNKELADTDAAAEEKLSLIIRDQKAAQIKKGELESLVAGLGEKEADIAVRKQEAEASLAEVEPMVKEAQQSVKSINKLHLDELRRLNNPPEGVKLAIEAVLLLLGEKSKVATDWTAVRSIMRKDDFIQRIIMFQGASASDKLLAFLEKKYLANPSFTFESVNRASRAAGPMVKWVASQVQYLRIVANIAPLRAEVQAAEDALREVREQAASGEAELGRLQESITRTESEYAQLLRTIEKIKAEKETTQARVDRCSHLLTSLESEQERWLDQAIAQTEGTNQFNGDLLLASAFTAYATICDERLRLRMLLAWMAKMDTWAVAFNPDLTIVDVLTTPADIADWDALGLPPDSVCRENAAVLAQTSRTPFLLDETETALPFIKAKFKGVRLLETSFTEPGCMQQLEQAVRFGLPIVMRAAEHADPGLNNLLSFDRSQTGSATVQIGGKQLDFSPTFKLFLLCETSSATLPPDLVSRTAVISFASTPGTLTDQCLTNTVDQRLPDVGKQRAEFLLESRKLTARIHSLEEQLLAALNQQTDLLADESILKSLETLQVENAAVNTRRTDVAELSKQLDNQAQEYAPVAEVAARLFFLTARMRSLDPAYVISPAMFRRMFIRTLETNPEATVDELVQLVCNVTYSVAGAAMSSPHRLALAVAIAAVRQDQLSADELDVLALGVSRLTLSKTAPIEGAESHPHGQLISYLSTLDLSYQKILQLDPNPSAAALIETIGVGRAMIWHRLTNSPLWSAAASSFVASVMGPGFSMLPDEMIEDISKLVAACPKAPVVLVATPGYDPTFIVTRYCEEHSVPTTSLAVGDLTAVQLAQAAARVPANGALYVQNVHLADSALLDALVSAENSMRGQLIISTASSLRVHPAMLASGLCVAVEEPLGLAGQVARLAPAAMLPGLPAEAARVDMLLAFLHCIICQRSRNAPEGFARPTSWTRADYAAARSSIMQAIRDVSQGRTNVPPEDLPWSIIRELLIRAVYGAKMGPGTDYAILQHYVENIMRAESFDPDFELDGVSIPTAANVHSWLHTEGEHINHAPESIGLTEHATMKQDTVERETFTAALCLLRESETGAGSTPYALDSWISVLRDVLALPMPEVADSSISALLASERSELKASLCSIKSNLESLLATPVGNRTPEQWNLHGSLAVNVAPDSWGHGTCEGALLDLIAKYKNLLYASPGRMQFNALSRPIRMLSVLRQTTSDREERAIEELHLAISFEEVAGGITTQVTLEECSVTDNIVSFAPGTAVVDITLYWTATDSAGFSIPVFGDASRSVFIDTVSIQVSDADKDLLIRRSAAILM
ncbi:Dynein heavy chain, N-terminal region 2 [Carpediemonas membranifera]|uniref:Dynein heavy chain, cytoplasmic n=1 Tax=Carpediemonas membranifera TaxID=201153 RepID=A0A8J6AWR9_9EUKA|nr:Dynein heavy chain, N-terminal region 2 [Carpediemonas membranifera]|eukprot:KAG9393495.1 Dynein heavy chain, N-terminal region 2 [Carpediemonas membranifera]